MMIARLLAACALCTVIAVAPAAAQQIGTVASVTPALRGTPPGGAERGLAQGAGVVRDETVVTSAAGRAQLLFLDQTTLSVAPNSRIVLDRFVFDPAAGRGDMGVQLTTGALRFIGGAVGRDEPVEVTTPTATIGVRGSSALVAILQGETYAVFIAGARMCITNADARQVCTNRPGGVLGPDGYEGQAADAFIAQLVGLIDGPPGPIVASGGGTGGTGIDGVVRPGEGPFSSRGELNDEGEFDETFPADNDRLSTASWVVTST